jgi:uncharacterized protein (TIGR00255 family)
MTGYGRATSVLDGKNYIIETKSVNHRGVEVAVRLPGMFASLETEIKKVIGQKLFRGRIEVYVRVESDLHGEVGEKLEANLPLIKHYYSLLNQVKQEFDLKDEITLSMIARLKDIFYYSECDVNLEKVWKHLQKILVNSIDFLIKMREKEGKLLHKDFVLRLNMIRDYLNALKLRVPQVVVEYQERLSRRVRELTDSLEIDESRLSQEVAIMAEKSDVTEEIVRFESHLSQFEEMLESNDPIGRKMDFLLQEMLREVNTAGSKSSDLNISHIVIEIKSELAKLREQVQNVE